MLFRTKCTVLGKLIQPHLNTSGAIKLPLNGFECIFKSFGVPSLNVAISAPKPDVKSVTSPRSIWRHVLISYPEKRTTMVG